jgi:Spy/CpxP family protein refolding chaperone
MIKRTLILCAGLLVGTAAHAQPYAGQQSRSIKALSNEEVKQYLAGDGLSYAKAAELNSYPGPLHTLDLTAKLDLSAAQRDAIAALMHAHKAEARELGRKFVDAEQALDAAFRSAKLDEHELATRVRAVAALQGEYRLSHLETHRKMRALLSMEQVARYDALRGYGEAASAGNHSGTH